MSTEFLLGRDRDEFFNHSGTGDLLPTLLAGFFSKDKELTLLDPFCGMGTTVLSAQTQKTHRINSIGIEYNPFIRFAASLNALDLENRVVLESVRQSWRSKREFSEA